MTVIEEKKKTQKRNECKKYMLTQIPQFLVKSWVAQPAVE